MCSSVDENYNDQWIKNRTFPRTKFFNRSPAILRDLVANILSSLGFISKPRWRRPRNDRLLHDYHTKFRSRLLQASSAIYLLCSGTNCVVPRRSSIQCYDRWTQLVCKYHNDKLLRSCDLLKIVVRKQGY